MRQLDLTRQQFGRLTVTEKAGVTKHHNVTWFCTCECDGKQIVVAGGKLRSGETTSCGCVHKERARVANTTHGQANKSRTYSSWASMKARCSNPKNISYPKYGARGITVCDRWLGDRGFENFFADMGERPKGKTLDREDPNGSYEPGNCRWLDLSGQARNQRKRLGTTSKYRGVTLARGGRKFVASITINSKPIYLGRFDTEESAATAYNEAAKTYLGDAALLNQIAA